MLTRLVIFVKHLDELSTTQHFACLEGFLTLLFDVPLQLFRQVSVEFSCKFVQRYWKSQSVILLKPELKVIVALVDLRQ